MSDYTLLTHSGTPLAVRCKLFNAALSEFGALDAQTLSNRMNVSPQLVTAYYELNDISKEELKVIEAWNLDISVLCVLMNMSRETRTAIYPKLGALLRDPHPVHRIIDFVNQGAGNLTIADLYAKTERKYWGAVANALKARNIENGTITRGFRAMLVGISIRQATEPQLQWLERGIRHDAVQKLGVFDTPSLVRDFPDAVNHLKEFRG